MQLTRKDIVSRLIVQLLDCCLLESHHRGRLIVRSRCGRFGRITALSLLLKAASCDPAAGTAHCCTAESSAEMSKCRHSSYAGSGLGQKKAMKVTSNRNEVAAGLVATDFLESINLL